MRAARGFTLIEIMVVVVIIGVMVAGGVLALGLADGGDRQLGRARERLTDLFAYAQDRAELENRDYGLVCEPQTCRFVAWDARDRRWAVASDDLLGRPVNLPADWQFSATIEGRRALLLAPGTSGQKADDDDDKKDALKPLGIMHAGGELSDFELRIGDADQPARVVFRANNAPEERSRSRQTSLPQPRIEVWVDGERQER